MVETILEWGIFDSLGIELQGRSLALTHDLEADVAYSPSCAEVQPQPTLDDRELCGELSLLGPDVKTAVQSFIENVHSKNPIVELGSLREAANNCQMNGFGTDGFSALVVSLSVS